MTEAPWYDMAHLYACLDGRARPGVVTVRVGWAGREFPASIDHQGWFEPYTREALPLASWGPDAPAEPERWQPEDAEAWPWPGGQAPAPRAGLARRFVSLPSGPTHYTANGERIAMRTRRWAAMAEQHDQSARAQAAIRAELGEAGPAGAAAGDGSGGAGAEPHTKIGLRWWLAQPELVTYSPVGADVSLAEVEGRLCRAILTDGLRPGKRPMAWQGTAGALAAMVAETLTSEDARAFEPTRADITDQDGGAPLAWFARLSPPQLRHRHAEAWALNGLQSIIVQHACGRSWRKIDERSNGVQARRDYAMAIEAAHRAANGLAVFEHVTIRDEMDELRARNRRAKGR